MERTPASSSSSSPVEGSSPEGGSVEIERLIAAGKCKQALELAKIEHKRHPGAQTEGRLMRAYVARVEQFYDKGMIQDARTQLAHVRQRFPGCGEELKRLELRSAAAEGRLLELLAPLADAGTTPATRALIEQMIRQNLVDLPALASCHALPAEHPLRVVAGAVWRAFEAVAAGPVSDEQIALPEVSHRSPLAGWKMLVRAIAAFYRHDDAACRRALDAIADDTVVGPLAHPLRAMLDGTPPRAGLAGALQARVTADDRPLREALEKIETAFRRTDLGLLKRSIRLAVQACGACRPDFLERLRQHISVACVLQAVPADHVIGAMGASRKDAYFWRLMARASEREGAVPLAALYWERFVRHAIAEGMFADRSLEAAMVYQHAAAVLVGLSLVELRRAREQIGRRDIFRSYYHGQAPQIAALAPPSDKKLVETVLSPGWFFERSAEIHPAPETFRLWWAWAQDVELPNRSTEDIARRWHEKQPGDPQPLLLLSDLAEKRGALKLAIKHLAAAEALDAIHPQVRQARVRLTLATTWRHFKDKKPHLVENDLAELSALPAMGQGDRAAFVAAVRAAWHALRRDPAATQQSFEQVVAQAGALEARVLLETVAEMTRVPRNDLHPDALPTDPPDPHDVARAEARTVALATELGLKRVRPAAWDNMINQVLREQNCPLSQAELLAIGRAAAERGAREQAYLASSAGLATASNPATIARFLALRAQGLTASWADWRAVQCLAAARDLARQSHDPALLDDVFSQIDHHPAARYGIELGEDGKGLGEDVLAEILKLEREAREFPKGHAEADRYLAHAMKPRRLDRLPFGAFPLGGDEDEDEDDDAFDDGPDDFDPVNLPQSLDELDPELLDFLLDKMNKTGRPPKPSELIKRPDLLLKLLMAMGRGGAIPDLLDEPEDEPGPRGFFGRFAPRKKHKKRRR